MDGLNNKLNTDRTELTKFTIQQNQLFRVQSRDKAKGNMKGILRNTEIDFGLTKVYLDVQKAVTERKHETEEIIAETFLCLREIKHSYPESLPNCL